MNTKITLLVLLCIKIAIISGSDGDRSPFYQKCLRICTQHNCSKDGGFIDNAVLQQDIWSKVLLWSCPDECEYHCMWKTVKVFQENGAETPKFYGKWPFVKFLGMQEPASVFSSLLNLAANAHMYMKICSEFTVRSSPLVLFWHLFAFVCMNAWVWSSIFHARDKPFTEFMDYACALSMVMGLFVAAVVRIFQKRRKLTALILTVPLFYFVTHVKYLYSGAINYDYNMKVNVVFGVLGSVLWLWWSVAGWARGRRGARALALFTAGSGGALTLELLDFPPLAHVWDAHALWHFATAPLPLLFYSFVIEDLRYSQLGQYEKFNLKLT